LLVTASLNFINSWNEWEMGNIRKRIHNGILRKEYSYIKLSTWSICIFLF